VLTYISPPYGVIWYGSTASKYVPMGVMAGTLTRQGD